MGEGQDSQWGSLSCGSTELRSGHGADDHKETKEWAPVPRFLDAVQLTKDVTDITDAARGKTFSKLQ